MIDFSTVAPITKMSGERLSAFAEAVSKVDDEGVPGDIVQCGVWRGGGLLLAMLMSPRRVVWGFDTFSGMPKPEPIDTKRGGGSALEKWISRPDLYKGWMAASMEEVVSNLAPGFAIGATAHLIKGKVEDTLLSYELPSSIAVLHLDTDWHASTKVELEVLFPLLSPGGVLIVDDYGHWMGCCKAVDRYFQGHPAHSSRVRDFRKIDYTGVWMVKV